MNFNPSARSDARIVADLLAAVGAALVRDADGVVSISRVNGHGVQGPVSSFLCGTQRGEVLAAADIKPTGQGLAVLKTGCNSKLTAQRVGTALPDGTKAVAA